MARELELRIRAAAKGLNIPNNSPPPPYLQPRQGRAPENRTPLPASRNPATEHGPNPHSARHVRNIQPRYFDRRSKISHRSRSPARDRGCEQGSCHDRLNRQRRNSYERQDDVRNRVKGLAMHEVERGDYRIFPRHASRSWAESSIAMSRNDTLQWPQDVKEEPNWYDQIDGPLHRDLRRREFHHAKVYQTSELSNHDSAGMQAFQDRYAELEYNRNPSFKGCGYETYFKRSDRSPTRKHEARVDVSIYETLPPQQLGQKAPMTTYDLRSYDDHITKTFSSLPQNERFINGNGKVRPSIYGSSSRNDLGLCFSTFCTRYACEIGVRCPWRHHPLSKAEVDWILETGGDRGRKFLKLMDSFWACPGTPLPGASMVGKGE
ncbi:hypothetical protein ACN47E_008315 [Coniothyrium glycines]